MKLKVLLFITSAILFSCTKKKLSKKGELPNGNWEWLYSTDLFGDTLLNSNQTSDSYRLDVSDYLNYQFYKNGTPTVSVYIKGLSEYSSNSFTPKNQEIIFSMRYRDSTLNISGGYPYEGNTNSNIYKLKP